MKPLACIYINNYILITIEALKILVEKAPNGCKNKYISLPPQKRLTPLTDGINERLYIGTHN